MKHHFTKSEKKGLSTSYLLTIFCQFQAASLLSRVGGGGWVVIIKLKSNLSSNWTETWTGLELSLAIGQFKINISDFYKQTHTPSSSSHGICCLVGYDNRLEIYPSYPVPALCNVLFPRPNHIIVLYVIVRPCFL